ncbi:Serine/threonine-protein kinase, partial [Coemansia sp. RSA 2598]
SEARGDIPAIKVADFGFARNLPSSALAETLCGSPLYMAPEILHYEPYDAKADLWSIGAVVYEMMTGRQPFHASNHVELARIIERTNDNIVFPDEKQKSLANTAADAQSQGAPLDPVLKDLVRKLLKMKPADRMSFEDFFAHPALQYPADSQPLGPGNQLATGISGNAVLAEDNALMSMPAGNRRIYQDDRQTIAAAMHNINIAATSTDNAAEAHDSNNGRYNQGAAHPHYPPQPYQHQEPLQQRYPPNRKPSNSNSNNTNNTPVAHHPYQQSSPRLPSKQIYDRQPPNAQQMQQQPQQQHRRQNSLTEEEQALAEREYV